MTATAPCRNRVCVLFDFDLTLAPDSFSALLRRCGVDAPDAWREAHVQPLVEAGWEPILARVHSLVRLSRSGAGPRITVELVREAGRSIEPFEGVPAMFGAIRESAAAALPGLEVEFYLLTSGFSDLHRAVSFAGEFAGI